MYTILNIVIFLVSLWYFVVCVKREKIGRRKKAKSKAQQVSSKRKPVVIPSSSSSSRNSSMSSSKQCSKQLGKWPLRRKGSMNVNKFTKMAIMKKATPKRTPMSAKEKIIAKGEKRNAEDYPTMADIVSDWESKDDVDKKNSKSRKVKKGESGSVIFESMIRGGEEIDITMRSEKSKKKLEEHLDRGDNKGKEKLAGGVIERKDNMERQEEKPEEKQGKTGEDALERQINAESDKKRKDREGKCSTDNANVVEIKDNGITESERNVEINSTKKKLNMTDMNKECYASLMKNKSSAHEPQATTEKPDYSKTKLHREAVEKKGEANKNEKDSVYMETDSSAKD